MSARIESALSYVSAHDRETWVAMAMAVKNELGEDGFDLWDAWSRNADSYNASAAKAVWKSCRGQGVTVGTLFHAAKASGWIDREKPSSASPEQVAARRREMQERATREGMERAREQENAAKKAAWIMHKTVLDQHAYMQSKGWPDAKVSVWWASEDSNLMCIPMRVGDALVGIQMIDRTGAKKFLKGQRTSEAEYLISNNGRGAVDWFVEGYCTGLSLRECLQALRLRYRIHITFSAGNLAKVAAGHADGYVVADQDASGTGERVAVQTGFPFFLPPVGDFNDFHRSVGTFQASQALRKWLLSVPADRKSIAIGIANGSQRDRPSH
jgi:putative DNA primase/helicase